MTEKALAELVARTAAKWDMTLGHEQLKILLDDLWAVVDAARTTEREKLAALGRRSA